MFQAFCLFCIWQKQNKYKSIFSAQFFFLLFFFPKCAENGTEDGNSKKYSMDTFISHIIMSMYEFINLLAVVCIKIEMLTFSLTLSLSRSLDFSLTFVNMIPLSKIIRYDSFFLVLFLWKFIRRCVCLRVHLPKYGGQTIECERRLWPLKAIPLVKVWWGECEQALFRPKWANEMYDRVCVFVEFCGCWHVHKMRTTFEIIISIKVHLWLPICYGGISHERVCFFIYRPVEAHDQTGRTKKKSWIKRSIVAGNVEETDDASEWASERERATKLKRTRKFEPSRPINIMNKHDII